MKLCRSLVFLLLTAVLAGACAGEDAAGEAVSRPPSASEQEVSTGSSSDQGPSPSAAPSEEESTDVEPMVVAEQFSKRRAMRHVRYLAGEVGVRVRATRGETLGARYAAAKFRAYRYDVTIQKFSVDGGTSRNVVASWPGSKKYPVVIGGHMDSVPGAPGANDNASGIGVILELARIFRSTPQVNFTKFVAFGSEEYGTDDRHHVGSQIYVQRLGEDGRSRLAGMVSVDMIADGRPLLVGNSGIAHDRVADALYRQVVKRGIDVRRITLCDCSDHGPFEHAGISAAFAYSGTTDYYHSSADTIDKVKPEDVRRTGQAMKAFIKAFDGRYMTYLRSR